MYISLRLMQRDLEVVYVLSLFICEVIFQFCMLINLLRVLVNNGYLNFMHTGDTTGRTDSAPS